jgi:uncharacterized protein (DUF58 family)
VGDLCMTYPTGRAIFLAALGVPLALLAALFAPQLWLVGVAWIFFAGGLFLLDALIAADPTRLVVTSKLPSLIGVGQPQDAQVSLAFSGFAPRAVEFALDSNTRLAVRPERQICEVAGHETAAQFSLVPLRRGTGRIEQLWMRWRGPLGLSFKQRADALGKDIPVIPNIQQVKDQAVRLFQRDRSYYGLRAQLHVGDGAEFHALRAFMPGMERRTIDWKQSARHGALLSREFQAEENLHIVFALDTGRLMCEPLEGQPRIDRALQAMLLLSYVGLKSGDRIGFFAFDEKVRVASGTVAGPAGFPVLHRLASQIDYSTAETNFTLGLTQLSAELEHRSIVIVFTEFADTTSAELMLENINRLLARHLVFFVAFRDEELETMIAAEPKEPEDVSRAVVADAVMHEREIVIAKLKRMGVRIVDAPLAEISTRLLETYLVVKNRGGI